MKKGIPPPKSQSPPGNTQDNNPDTQHLDLDNCQCHDTGRCICALKSDTAESQPGHFMPPPASSRRPRLFQSQSSEPHHMTVFANGHHKPVHRNNNAAHECGVPYRIPNFHPPTALFKATAHRSTESLPTLDSLERDAATSQNPSVLEGVNTERRMSKSEQTSPLIRPFVNTPPSDSQGSISQPTTASLDIPYLSGAVPGEPTPSWIDTSFSCQDSDVGLLSATSLGPDMWSWTGNDLPIGNRNRSESDPLSWANANGSLPTQPALTHASSSGPQSEIEDPFNFEDAVLAQQLSGPPSTGSQPITTADFGPWDNLNMTENLQPNEPVNNRWSMPSFPDVQTSSVSNNSSTTLFPDQQKNSFADQTNIIGRPASLHHTSMTYNNNNTITSQPRSSSTYAVSGIQATQTRPTGASDLNSSTTEWLKDLGLDCEVNESEIFGDSTNGLGIAGSIDTSNNMPMGSVLPDSAFDGNDFSNTATLPPSTSRNKNSYTQPHGLPSWNNSSTNLGEVNDPSWLS